jgi:hypothetical protein
VLIATRRIVDLLVLTLVKEDAMNAHRFALGDTAFPDRREGRIQGFRWLVLIDLIDKGYVCTVRDDKVRSL